MIRSVSLKNFQSHELTELEFSPSMNIIHGESDEGKSAILRGMIWNILNRPDGDLYRRHETDLTEVNLETEKSAILRRRSDKKNEYEMDEKVFKALRSEVPEDIQVALNLTEANIQQQHEVYFLVDKSPGQVSRKLNEVAGLELMDSVMKKVNSEVRTINSEINTTSKLYNEAKRKAYDLKWVDKADKFLIKLENYEDKIIELKDEYDFLDSILTELEELEKLKEKFISDEIIEELNEIFSLQKTLAISERKYNYTTQIVTSIKILTDKKKTITIIDIKELENLAVSLKSEEDKMIRVQFYIKSLSDLNTLYDEVSEELKETDIAYKAVLKKLGKCPTCYQEIK